MIGSEIIAHLDAAASAMDAFRAAVWTTAGSFLDRAEEHILAALGLIARARLLAGDDLIGELDLAECDLRHALGKIGETRGALALLAADRAFLDWATRDAGR